MNGWRVEQSHRVRLVRCEALDRIPGIAHGYSTRYGSGDLGAHDDPSPAVAGRRREFLAACGLEGRKPTVLRQVHGRSVVDVDVRGFASGCDGDAAVAVASGLRGWAPAVRWADCVPLLLADADGGAIAAVHAGWRGIVAGVVPAALDALRDRGRQVPKLVAALGPAVGACCYEVADVVAARVARSADVAASDLTTREGPRLLLDLRRAVRFQLVREGLAHGSIHTAPWCTACDETLFDSYRRRGSVSGRQMACVGWAA